MINYRNTERRRVDGLREKAAAAGFDLPKSILTAIAKETGLRADLIKTREAQAKVPNRSDLAAQLRSAGGIPKEFPNDLSALREEAANLKELESLVALGVEQQEEHVARMVSDEADEIIQEQLQPRLVEILATVREHIAAFPSIPWDNFDAAMRLTDAAARDAYVAVKVAHDQYMALREALGLLYKVVDGDAGLKLRHEIKNLREVWPNYQYRDPGNRHPWPSNSMARLAWLVTNGAELWVPTPDEADEEELRQMAAIKSGFPIAAHSVEVIRQ